MSFPTSPSEMRVRSRTRLRPCLPITFLAALVTLALPATTARAAADGGAAVDPKDVVKWLPPAPPLPKPSGAVIRVTNVDELYRAAEDVKPGGTIVIADGHYRMPRYFEVHTDDVTVRGESGRREAVVLDAADSRHGELFGITRCAGVTVADLTIQNVRYNGFKINSDLGATRVTIHNCVIRNVWQRGVKGPAVRPEDRATMRPTDVQIRHCLFVNDRAKRFEDDETDTPQTFDGNYVGGIDAMYARRWVIRDNAFVGIRGRTGEARGAVFLWQEAEECVVERNAFVDCDSAVCLGNGFRPDDVPVHATACVVRNNFVTRCGHQGILAEITRDCRIVHNTVHDPGSRLRRLIRLAQSNDGILVANNLLSGPAMSVETPGPVELRENVQRELPDDAFADVGAGDLHLTQDLPGVADAAEAVGDLAPRDFDGEPRGAQPDVGADERANAEAGRAR